METNREMYGCFRFLFGGENFYFFLHPSLILQQLSRRDSSITHIPSRACAKGRAPEWKRGKIIDGDKRP